MKTNMEKITMKEVWSRIIIILFAIFCVYLATEEQKQYISLAGFLISFFGSLYLHKHFFPLMTAVFLCYLLAILQEVWSHEYAYLPITKFLWTLGNFLFPIAIGDFAYRLKYKYKIVKNVEK